MDNTVRDIVQDRILALARSIIAPWDSPNLMFGASGVRLFEDGDAVDGTLVSAGPVGIVGFEDEDVSETTTKIMQTMGFIIGVEFEVAVNEETGAFVVQPRKRYNSIIAELKKTFLLAANRHLPATPGGTDSQVAHDVRYLGAHTMIPLSSEIPCRNWGGGVEFEVDYRHLTSDPTVVS